MTILDILGLIVGLFLFYLGYLFGPYQWRITRKSIRAIEREEDIDLEEKNRMRQYSSGVPFFSRISILYFVIGMIACFPFINFVLQKQFDANFYLDSDGLSGAEKALQYEVGVESLEKIYQRGAKALKEGNYSDAEKYIRKAALGGDSDAQFSLAMLYEHGFGLPKDGMQACYWYRVAADNGSEGAQKALMRTLSKDNKEDGKTWQEENC